MFIDRYQIRENLISVSIVLFIVFYMGFIYWKPGFLYNKDGSLRAFGVGYSRKTVVPAWVAITKSLP